VEVLVVSAEAPWELLRATAALCFSLKEMLRNASIATNDIVPHTICWPRHHNVWSSSGASMPCSLLPGHDDGVAVDDLGETSEAIGTPAEREDSNETPEHSATVSCRIIGGA
jgi:hypothetical protein